MRGRGPNVIYGNWSGTFSFTTQSSPMVTRPEVQTLAATSVTENSARLNGRVTDTGGATIADCSFEWAKNSGNWSTGTPGVDYGVILDADITKSGSDFSAVLDRLQANTIYKYRAYARNSAGVSDVNLVNIVMFTTTQPSPTTLPSNACDRQDLAKQILARSDKITLRTMHDVRSDSANAWQNIQDTANGGQAMRSSYGDADSSPGNAPGGSTWLDRDMLDVMLKLADTYTFTVTEIAGGGHQTTPTPSPHYSGKAFDVGMIGTTRVSDMSPNNSALQNFKKACTDLGANQVLGPGDDGKHETHVHVGWVNLPAPGLSAPLNGAANVPTTPEFSWIGVTTGDSAGYETGATEGYVIALATSPGALPTDATASTLFGLLDYRFKRRHIVQTIIGA
ncbi:MAG: hypothetical protein O2960_09400 [Verrucomicrobia bacterium]|nr:hypothetical protein [Verrucomicrobiota bacterium]